MTRVRVSTTVDKDLLDQARRALAPSTDSSVMEAALRALLEQHREAQIDASYAAYDQHPLDEPDEWGDLASWRSAAAAT
jgi:hypothetical protein